MTAFTRLQENVSIAWSTLLARKVRSLLTLLGVVVGVASVIAVAAVIDGLNRNVLDRIGRLGARTFYFTRMPVTNTPARLPEKLRKRRYFDYSYSSRIRELCPSVEAVSIGATRTAVLGDRNEIRYGAQTVDQLVVRGVEPGYADALPNFAAGEGRFINQDDVARARHVVAIGTGIAAALFPGGDAMGRVVRLNGKPYEVVGVLLPGDSLAGSVAVDEHAVIPTTTFQKEYPEMRELVLSVSVRPDVPRDQGVEELVQALRRIRHVRVRAPNDFDMTSSDYLFSLWSQLTSALVVLATVLSSIGLLVGGLGVMNIMLISVTERTAEIGVRKAIGARRNDIRVQFLLEAMMLTGCGGLIGVGLGAAIAWLVREMYPAVQATLSYQWAALGVLMSVGVGLVFGYFPANRAAGLDPIVCLRYE